MRERGKRESLCARKMVCVRERDIVCVYIEWARDRDKGGRERERERDRQADFDFKTTFDKSQKDIKGKKNSLFLTELVINYPTNVLYNHSPLHLYIPLTLAQYLDLHVQYVLL